MLGVVELDCSTAGHRPEEQPEVWRQIVAETFTPVLVDCRSEPVPGRFHSHLQSRRIGDLGLAWLTASAHSVCRTTELIMAAPRDAYFVNVVQSGTETVEQGGRVTSVQAGQIALVDSERPFTLGFDTDFEHLCLMVPKSLLSHPLASVEPVTGVAIDPESAAGVMIGAVIRAVSMQCSPLSARETDVVVRQLAELVALLLTQGAAPPRRSARATHLQRIHDEIGLSLVDATLTPGELVRRVSISVSYLTKLLAGEGTTFGRLILERRLEYAWQLLDSPWGAGTTIMAVAQAAGFRDSAHFSRTFRSRYGMTPSQRRTAADDNANHNAIDNTNDSDPQPAPSTRR